MGVERDLAALLRDWDTYGGPLKKLLNKQPEGPKEAGPTGITDAVILTTMPAAVGLVDGSGSVVPLDDDGTGTRTMKHRKKPGTTTDLTVTVRNPFNQAFTPNASGKPERKCQYANVGGFLKLISVDCPTT